MPYRWASGAILSIATWMAGKAKPSLALTCTTALSGRSVATGTARPFTLPLRTWPA
jgi:Na+/H+ antiporter NhaC